MAVGGSHTNFDTTSFGVGAVAGTALIAGALGRGIQNLRTQRASFAAWQNIEALRAVAELSEGLRFHENELHREREQASAKRIEALQLENERLRTRIKLAAAQLR